MLTHAESTSRSCSRPLFAFLSGFLSSVASSVTFTFLVLASKATTTMMKTINAEEEAGEDED